MSTAKNSKHIRAKEKTRSTIESYFGKKEKKIENKFLIQQFNDNPSCAERIKNYFQFKIIIKVMCASLLV